MKTTLHSPWDQYLQRRSRGFGWTLVVMGLSFALYYLGLFGNETGVLSPDNIAAFLSRNGVDQSVFISIFFTLFVATLIWNHCMNVLLWMSGQKNPETFIRKGVISHTIWVGALVLFLIVLWHAR